MHDLLLCVASLQEDEDGCGSLSEEAMISTFIE